MKGQAAVEYAMILGLVLVALIPIFYISLQNTNNSVKSTQASDLVNQIASAANTVYALGPGSTRYITINMPQGVSLATVNQNEVRLIISINGKSSDVTALAKANFSTANLPTQPGQYSIKLINDGVNKQVVIGDLNDTFPPVISNLKPINNSLLTYSPIELSVITNEYSVCKYLNSMDNFYNTTYESTGTLFTTTGQTIHKVILSLGNGTYSYSINCKDSAGNIPGNPIRTKFTVNTSDDNDYPVITLINPENNKEYNESNIDFFYNVTDPTSDIQNCTLSSFGILDNGQFSQNSKTDITVSENQTNLIQDTLQKGNYSWYVVCVDKSVKHNTNISKTWNFRVNVTLGSGTVISCPQYCYELGKIGNCDNTPSCHGSNILYSGGNVYCTINPNRFCCCNP